MLQRLLASNKDVSHGPETYTLLLLSTNLIPPLSKTSQRIGSYDVGQVGLQMRPLTFCLKMSL